MNVIIVTGASSGMGAEFVWQLDRAYKNVQEIWMIARRKQELLTVSHKKKLVHNTRILAMDLTCKADMGKFRKLLADEKPAIRILVNSAGYGIMGDFATSELHAQLGMIDTNCKALTEMTYACIPYMKKNSHIIQLASSAAFLPQQNFAVYAATKSYVYSFSRALRQELLDKQIYVTAVCPGPVDTPFFDIAEKSGKTLAIKKLAMARADRVVKKAIKDTSFKRERSVYGFLIKGLEIAAKIIPHRIILDGLGYRNRAHKGV